MKQRIGVLALVLTGLVACKNTSAPQNLVAVSSQESNASPQPTGIEVASNAITDPVCGMEKDSTWTDYTMYKGDSVWFCSAPEKTAFLGNPTKYEKNLPHH